jgi:hypothetical protein
MPAIRDHASLLSMMSRDKASIRAAIFEAIREAGLPVSDP